jgi:DNA-binding MarR family transcriptional regulator
MVIREDPAEQPSNETLGPDRLDVHLANSLHAQTCADKYCHCNHPTYSLPMAKWLDDEEQRAWRALVDVTTWLHGELDSELMVAHDLTEGDYGVIATLSEAAGRELRMCDLAAALHLSPSGLTRRLDGLVKRDLVVRRPALDDRRATMAVLTDLGYALVKRAAPLHVAGVRRHLFDHLNRTQIKALGVALDRVRTARDNAAANA